MAVSVFDLFKIGIGPSSSHTVGPMRAAARFVGKWLDEAGTLEQCVRVRVELFGSLALTGRGHGTDKAVLMGLEGQWPNSIDPDLIPAALARIRADKKVRLLGKHAIAFDEKTDLIFNKRQKLPFHSNGMRFSALAEGAINARAPSEKRLPQGTVRYACEVIVSGDCEVRTRAGGPARPPSSTWERDPRPWKWQERWGDKAAEKFGK